MVTTKREEKQKPDDLHEIPKWNLRFQEGSVSHGPTLLDNDTKMSLLLL